MGGSSSKEDTPDVISLWVRVKADGTATSQEQKAISKTITGRERTVALDVPSRTTFWEVKSMLKDRHNVFPNVPVDHWELSVSGMDGAPRMFAFPNGVGVPDSNAYLCEAGIQEAAELVAFIPAAEDD
mmetsp:Transcript_63178/g.131389  ORF Transcript_63178/g.131389 Transcript_63178/m.131389 type:complete len:128 (+) Transcript_63178:220-603(+)|eukprot:CAMPEP_0181326328 /NCGR_PEP_ID=MMETSP1101-20121128/21434_1 /TAXON_ID=46948 /ORGANISM="Rhodomonas abbreviata, Strain Caron Lab Isolate" /LENGTH=127 /DNA_ID=CAMNT_0023434763 /DNA_START=194 /DNA_END=577 /DNA_ORIENTATION=+